MFQKFDLAQKSKIQDSLKNLQVDSLEAYNNDLEVAGVFY